MTATQFVNVAMPKMIPGLSAVVNSPPQLLMEWLHEGGRGPMKVDDWRTKPCPSRSLAYETMPVPEHWRTKPCPSRSTGIRNHARPGGTL
jgi:hypothetical protein